MYITTNKEQITETLKEMFQKIQKHYNLIVNSKEYEKYTADTGDNEVYFSIRKILKPEPTKEKLFNKIIKKFPLFKSNHSDTDEEYKYTVAYSTVSNVDMDRLKSLGVDGFYEVYLFAYTMCDERKSSRYKTDKDIKKLHSVLDWDIDSDDWLEYYRKFIHITQLYQVLDKPITVKNPFSIKNELGYVLFALIGLEFSGVTYNDKYIDICRTEENNVQFVIEGDNKEVVFDLVFDETPSEKMVKNMLLILADHTKINGIKVSEITNVRDEVFANGERYLKVDIDKKNKLVTILLRGNGCTLVRNLNMSDFKAKCTVDNLYLDAFPKTIILEGTDEELSVAANISEFYI